MADPSDLPSQPNPERCADLFAEGEAFQAMQEWFGLSEETRLRAVDEAIVAASENNTMLQDRLKSARGLTESQHWTLRHLAALTSPAVEKIFTLDRDDVDLTEKDLRSLRNNWAGIDAFGAAEERLEERDEGVDFRVYPDDHDFATAQDFFHFDMPVQEMGKLLGYLAENLPPDHDFFRPGYWVFDEALGRERHAGKGYLEVVPPIRCCVDLISDDDLMARLPNAEGIFRLDTQFSDWMEQFLSAGLYPKASTLAKLIDYNPESSAPSSLVRGGERVIPIGAYYHALLRRITHLETLGVDEIQNRPSWMKVSNEKYMEITGLTADYLLSDSIMERYVPYLDSDRAWDDVLVLPGQGALVYEEREPEEGEAAKARKAQEFTETVRTVYVNLLATHDTEKATRIFEKYEQILGPKSEDLSEKTTFTGILRAPEVSDLDSIRPILEEWVRDRSTGELLAGEVEEILTAIQQSLKGENDRQYIIAQTNEGNIVGVMGLKLPNEIMKAHATTERSIEIVNTFVNSSQRSRGVGRALYADVEALARQQGFSEVLVNSGPRYKDSAWGFYTRLFGQPVAIIEDLYGPGGNAPVWRKSLQ